MVRTNRLVAPDGSQEYQLQRGYKCRDCGVIEEA
jgi:hypothetical protein